MEIKKTDCENKEKCYLNMAYGVLANIGNRTMIMPNCNDCNVYKPLHPDGSGTCSITDLDDKTLFQYHKEVSALCKELSKELLRREP